MVLDGNTLFVGSVPAICMLLFTVVGLNIKVPDDITGALQHFAAGLLLSAIGSELLPTLLQATGVRQNVYATVGFFAGMGVLIVMGVLLPEAHGHGPEDDHDHADADADADDEHGNNNLVAVKRNSSASGSLLAITGGRLKSANMSLRDTAKLIHEEYCNACVKVDAAAGHDHESKGLLVASSSISIADTTATTKAMDVVEKALPMSFLAAIVVDSFMDGFLIGIAGAAGPGATIIMAGSLSVEMSFVGLTLASACHGMPYSKSIPAALAGPIFLVVGAVIGGVVTTFVEGDPALMAGIMGFGTSALLFMVAEELLLEAHEDGEHVWWVDVQLYTGFYWGFMSTKFLPE